MTIPSGQWIATSAYPLSFEQFRVSKDSPEYLASAFLKNFERAGVEVEAERRACARKWYDYLVKNGGDDIIEKAVKWARNIAADNSHGYSQANRWGPDYDCSSFVTQAYRSAGLNIGGGAGVYTGNMIMYFTAVGFEKVSDVNLVPVQAHKKGNALLNIVNHTAMALETEGLYRHPPAGDIPEAGRPGLEQKFMKQIFTVIHGTVCCGIKVAAELRLQNRKHFISPDGYQDRRCGEEVEIRRDVYVLRDRIKDPIEYVQGTDEIPIVFLVRDYHIPEDAFVSVMVEKPSGKVVYHTVTDSGSKQCNYHRTNKTNDGRGRDF